MDATFFKIAGAVAGIGGIAIASVVYVLREVIRKEIFPQLTKEQAYKLLNRIVLLIFIVGVLGIVAYLVVNWQNRDRNDDSGRHVQPLTPTPATAELSGTVLDHNDIPIPGARVTIDEIPGMQAVETSSNGVFNLRDVPRKYGDGVRVRVVIEGYEPNPYTADVVLGKAPPIIQLRKKR